MTRPGVFGERLYLEQDERGLYIDPEAFEHFLRQYIDVEEVRLKGLDAQGQVVYERQEPFHRYESTSTSLYAGDVTTGPGLRLATFGKNSILAASGGIKGYLAQVRASTTGTFGDHYRSDWHTGVYPGPTGGVGQFMWPGPPGQWLIDPPGPWSNTTGGVQDFAGTAVAPRCAVLNDRGQIVPAYVLGALPPVGAMVAMFEIANSYPHNPNSPKRLACCGLIGPQILSSNDKSAGRHASRAGDVYADVPVGGGSVAAIDNLEYSGIFRYEAVVSLVHAGGGNATEVRGYIRMRSPNPPPSADTVRFFNLDSPTSLVAPPTPPALVWEPAPGEESRIVTVSGYVVGEVDHNVLSANDWGLRLILQATGPGGSAATTTSFQWRLLRQSLDYLYL